jgi:Flp pilus assembly protein TadG
MTMERTRGTEAGQMLVLFAFVCVALTFCVMLVVDVGFYMQERGITQNAADAAALAGAQELPGDPDAAHARAVEYLQNNGSSIDDVDITFECTSDSEFICTDGSGTYDTIVVTPKNKAPNFFGGLLALVGMGGSCWTDGCNVQAEAAGCRGACGPVGNAPVDVVEIIDRTGSMSAADLAGAKSSAETFLTNFDPTLQRVGLGVLGPSSTSSTCGSPNSGGLGIATSSGGSWLPVPMTNNFKNADGSLNTGSTIVKTARCLNTSSVGTNLGDPMKAAKDHLITQGRPDVKWGIVMMTDGAANAAPTKTVTGPKTTTSWLSCSANQAVTSSAGDNNGYQSNASAACSNGGSYAEDIDSGNNTNTTCTNTGKDKHRYYDFGVSNSVSSGSTIYGIEVRLDGWATGTGTKKMCVELSWNGGSSWTTPKEVAIGGSETTYTLGTAADLWGRTWSGNDFSNSNFRIRVTDVGSVSTMDFRLDYAAVRVTYAGQQTVWDGHLGPCDYADKQADLAKAAGIEIYMVAWGVDEDCTSEDPSSPWHNVNITDLMLSMATDSAHVYDEPKTTDLDGIFEAIGAQLAGGSKLIR